MGSAGIDPRVWIKHFEKQANQTLDRVISTKNFQRRKIVVVSDSGFQPEKIRVAGNSATPQQLIVQQAKAHVARTRDSKVPILPSSIEGNKEGLGRYKRKATAAQKERGSKFSRKAVRDIFNEHNG